MDLTKFLDLIINKSIYLRRIDKFEDPYEGYISSAYKADLDDQYQKIQKEHNISDENKERLHKTHLYGLELLPLYAYASCWFIGEVESAAMWKLYGGSDNCIAICSTINDLWFALDDPKNNDGNMYLREVNYVCESSEINSNNYLNPMFEKRLSFEHEKEFRALFILNKGVVNLSSATCIDRPEKKNVNTKDGVQLIIDVDQLINEIYISPSASPNFHSLVEKLINLAGLKGFNCIQSELYKLK